MWLPDGVWGDFWGSETVQCITILPGARKCPLTFPIYAGFNGGISPLAGEPNKLETNPPLTPVVGDGEGLPTRWGTQ